MTRINTKTPARLILICLASVFSYSAHSNVYKWVDEQGNVHYGQQRPSNAQVEKLDVERHAPQDTSSYKRPGQNKKATDEGKKDETDADAKEKKDKKPETAAEKKRRKAACAQARQQLATMQSIGRIRSKDKDGNTAYLSQQQKEARIKKIRESISKQCK